MRARYLVYVGLIGLLGALCGNLNADTFLPKWLVNTDVGNVTVDAFVYSGMGGILATGTYWNSWYQIADMSTAPGREDPYDSDGQPTAMRGYSYYAPSGGYGNWGDLGGANNDLNRDGLYNVGDAGNPVTTIITLGPGASASDRYAVAAYIAIPGYDNETYTFTLGGDTRTATTVKDTGGLPLAEGVNYVVFSDVAPEYAGPGDLLARFPFLTTGTLPATYTGYYLAFEARDNLPTVNSHIAGYQVALLESESPLELVEVGGTFAAGNVAREAGATAFAKDVLNAGGYAAHQISHLNDGVYGNDNSWIGDSDFSFAGVALAGTTRVSRIAFGRDNTPSPPYPGRDKGTYALQYTTVPNPNETTPDADWTTIGLVHNAPDDTEAIKRHLYAFAPVLATGIRIIAPTGNCIDELEVYRPAMTLSTVGGAFAVNDALGGSAFAYDIEGQDPSTPFPHNQPTGYGGAHTTVGVNDGNYGNPGCWLAGSVGSFVGVSFGSTLTTIGRVAWSRDGTGADQYHGDSRTAGWYMLQYTTVANPDNQTPAASWITIGSAYYMQQGDTTPPDASPNSTARRHVWSFPEVQATGIRLVMSQTMTAVDELEASAYAAPPLTLVEVGGTMDPTLNIAPDGTAFAKDVYPAADHSIPHLNDGLYGNPNSWLGNSMNSFAGVALAQRSVIFQIAFGRDNTGAKTDRDAGMYLLQYTTAANPDASTPDSSWTTLGAVYYDPADAQAHKRHLYAFDKVDATGVRIFATGNGEANGLAIDEIEVNANPTQGTLFIVR